MDPLSWAALGGLNIGMSALQAERQAKQRQQEAQTRAAEIEASPWTGRGPSTQVSTASPSVWANLLGSGINTLSQGSAINAAAQKEAMNELMMKKMQEPSFGGGQPMGWLDLMKMQQLSA
jgi:hypothetical protein